MRRPCCVDKKMRLRRRLCAPSAVAYVLCVAVVSATSGATSSGGGGGAAPPPTPSCSYFTARTVQIDAAPTNLLHINVRQNVQGTVKIIEQPRRAPDQSIPGDGRLTVAVNWTSDNAELLDRVRMEVNSIDMPVGKVVTIQLDADKPPESKTSTAVVAGSTAAGIVALVILIGISVAVARRSSSSATSYKKQQKGLASTDAVGTATRGDEADFYSDRATYPNSIFSVGEADNYFVAGDNRSTSSSRGGRRGRAAAVSAEPGSADPSTLNLSILYSEPATVDERRGYRRPPSNLSTDWASTASVQSSRRSSTKGGGHYEIIRPPRQPQPQQQFRAARQASPATASGRWESGGRPRYISGATADASQPPATPISRRGVGGGSGSANASSAARRAQYARRPPVGSYSLTASSVADEDEDDEEDESDYCSPVIEVPSEFASPSADDGERRALFSERRADGDGIGSATSAAAATSPRAAALTGPSSPPLLAKSIALLGVVAMLSGTAYSLCSGKPAANIVIVLPAGARVGSVRLFANRQLQPSFIETDWYLANKHLARVYDADDLPVSTNKPCTTKMSCPSAANKSLVECELGTQACVCERGYRMTSRLVCEDVDECQRDACPSGTFCRNAVGSFECLCPPGSFRHGAQCAACSLSCPSGQFEAIPCGLTADRICQPCQTCPPGSYAYKPCSGRQDTECIHDGVRLHASANVFAEQLPVDDPPPSVTQQLGSGATAEALPISLASGGSDGGHLEQMLHVSDHSERMSFVLKRPSGIQIHVDVSDLELTPQYQPVRYPTDESTFMLLNPTEAVRQEYRDVLANFCSQPLPDYYTLMLRIYRKRTTAIDYVVCNATRKNCPPLYRDGETATFRSFNTKCPKESPDYDTTLPVEAIADGGNSMLCTRRTALLTELFQQAAPSVAREEPLTFPSVECRQSLFKCDQCIEDSQCNDQPTTEKPTCCAAKCHAQQFCKEATSQICSHVQTECATGDLLQYVLTPRYEPNSFQCHLRRIPPQRLMRLAYRVTVPRTHDSSWNSTQKEANVPFLDTYVGTVKVDFFTILYNTTLNISDDVLLRGSGRTRRSSNYNFSVTSFAAGAASSSGQIRVSNYKTDMWLANVSSQLPFDISTTNWQSRHGCDLDVARSLRPATTPSPSKATRVQVAKQRVPSSTSRGTAQGGGSELLYSLRSQHLPTVKLTIPGNQSLLASLFPRSVIDHSTLHVEATSGVDGTLWEVLVTGRAKHCNSYVGISVSDRTANAQLARYDLIVSCTEDDREKQEPRFWARVKMSAPPPSPSTSGLLTATSAPPLGQLLQVTVTDSNTSVSYYVSATSPASKAAAVTNSLDIAVAPVPASDDNRAERNLPRSAVIVGVASIFFAIAVVSAYGLFAACRSLRHRKGGSSLVSSSKIAGSQGMRCCGSRTTAGLVTIYVLYRLAYAAVFSATALLLITRHFTSDSAQVAGDLGSFRDRTAKDAEAEMKRTSDWRVHELRRQQQALDERIDACRLHVAHKRSELSARVAALASQARSFRGGYVAARQAALATVQSREIARLRAHAADGLHNLSQQASWLLSAYGLVLEDSLANAWLRLPEAIRDHARANDDDFDDDKSKATSVMAQLQLAVGSGFLRSEPVSFLASVGIDRPHAVVRTLDTLHKLLATLDRSLVVADGASVDGTATADDNSSSTPPVGGSAFTFSKLLVKASRTEQMVDPGSQPLQQPKWQPAAGGLSSTVYVLIVAVDLLLLVRRLCSLASDVRRLRSCCRTTDSASRWSGAVEAAAADAPEAGPRSSMTAAISAVGSTFGGTTASGRPDSPASASAIVSRSVHSHATTRTANSQQCDPMLPQQQQPPSRATARSAVTSTTMTTGRHSASGAVTEPGRRTAATTMTAGSTPLPPVAPSSVQSSPSTVSSLPPPPPASLTCFSAAKAASSALRRAHARHVVAWLAIVAALVASAVVLDEHVLTRRLLLRASGLERLEGDSGAAATAGNMYTKLHARQLTRLVEVRLRDELDPLLHHLLGHDLLHVQETSWIMALHEARRCNALRTTGLPCQPSRLQQLLQQPTPGSHYNGSSTLLSASPCQMLPIASRQLTTDSRATLSHAVVFNDFQKYVNALRDVALTAIGTAVLFVNVLAIACVVELAVVRYLRARSILPLVQVDAVTVRRHLGLCAAATDIISSETASSGDGDRNDADDSGRAVDGDLQGRYSNSRAVSASMAAYSSERQDSHSLHSEAASERARSAAAQSSRSAALLPDDWDAIVTSAYAPSPTTHLDQSSAAAADGAADPVPAIPEPEGLMSDSWCHDGMFSAMAPPYIQPPPSVQPPPSSQSRVAVPAGDVGFEAHASFSAASTAAATASLLRAQGVQVLQAGETEL